MDTLDKEIIPIQECLKQMVRDFVKLFPTVCNLKPEQPQEKSIFLTKLMGTRTNTQKKWCKKKKILPVIFFKTCIKLFGGEASSLQKQWDDRKEHGHLLTGIYWYRFKSLQRLPFSLRIQAQIPMYQQGPSWWVTAPFKAHIWLISSSLYLVSHSSFLK